MGQLVVDISMSLDGYVAGPDQRLDEPLGTGGEDLHEWVFTTQAWQERELNDGSRHRVYKRWFTADGLAAELGGGETVHAGPWFVAVRSG